MKKMLIMITLFHLLSASACIKPANPPSGIVNGRVTDTQGRPVEGAAVIINNTVYFNRNIVVTTDATGFYQYKMPATDSWYVRGYVKVNFRGNEYELPLHPDFTGAFTGAAGKTVNLQWKLTGAIPSEFGTGGYYGGSAVAQPGYDMYDLTGVQLTLVPEGALIDGSTGATITQTVVKRSDGFVIQDIPIGRYTITAKLNGQALYLKHRTQPGSDYVSSLTADFEPAYFGANTYVIPFELATQQ